jgi:hypothetical protein
MALDSFLSFYFIGKMIVLKVTLINPVAVSIAVLVFCPSV